MPVFDPQVYYLAVAFMAAVTVAFFVRLCILQRSEQRLFKELGDSEKQVLRLKRELAQGQQDSGEWRTEAQRQFDLVHQLLKDQISHEAQRIQDVQNKANRREYELLTALDLAKQMCVELPQAKARILYLEHLLQSQPTATLHPATPAKADELDPMPALSIQEVPQVEASLSVRVAELEGQLQAAEKRQVAMNQALAASRLRTRSRAFEKKSFKRRL
jgi:hypothetical protein